MATNASVGVVVMAYGTPRSPEEIESYYTHIRRGRPPTPELLAELTARYEAIGGISPLAERTEAQRAAVARHLEALAPGRYEVVLGQKHAEPFIEDAVAAVAADGVERTVGLVLAPHFSRFSVGQYQERAATAAAEHGLTHVGIESWHTDPAYVSFLTDAVTEALATLPERTKVVFTAHSLPERVLVDDPYPDQLRESAAAVAEAIGLDRWAGWSLGWQSAGRTPEPWRGPDILEIVADLGATGRADGVLVCAQGFVADHLEVLYDLDIETSAAAREAGLAFARTRSLNDDDDVMAALAQRVHAAAG
ncbi:MAG: ferrochelatase [Acidimicrobiia bacterium]|nr:ferrochelatase [Acidimicrobiia bacterium]